MAESRRQANIKDQLARESERVAIANGPRAKLTSGGVAIDGANLTKRPAVDGLVGPDGKVYRGGSTGVGRSLPYSRGAINARTERRTERETREYYQEEAREEKRKVRQTQIQQNKDRFNGVTPPKTENPQGAPQDAAGIAQKIEGLMANLEKLKDIQITLAVQDIKVDLTGAEALAKIQDSLRHVIGQEIVEQIRKDLNIPAAEGRYMSRRKG